MRKLLSIILVIATLCSIIVIAIPVSASVINSGYTDYFRSGDANALGIYFDKERNVIAWDNYGSGYIVRLAYCDYSSTSIKDGNTYNHWKCVPGELGEYYNTSKNELSLSKIIEYYIDENKSNFGYNADDYFYGDDGNEIYDGIRINPITGQVSFEYNKLAVYVSHVGLSGGEPFLVESFTILDIDPFDYGFGGTIDNRRTEKRSDGIYYVWDKTPGAKYYEVILATLTRVDRWKYDSYEIRNDLIYENEILISGDGFNIFDYINKSYSGHDGFAKILIRPVFVTNEGKEVFGERVIEYFFDDDVSINHDDIIRADNFSSLKSTFSDDLGESIHFEENSKGVRIVWGKNTRLQYTLNELSSDCVVKLVVYKGTRVLFSSTLEDLSKPGSMDISSWVIENGTGRYRTLAFACYKSKDGEEKEAPLGSFRNSYLIDFSNYLYFTSNTPKLNRDIDVKKGDKYTITYRKLKNKDSFESLFLYYRYIETAQFSRIGLYIF